LGPLDPRGPWHLSSLVQWVLRHWTVCAVQIFYCVVLCCIVLYFSVDVLCCYRNLLASLEWVSGWTKNACSSLEASWQAAASLVGDSRTELVDVVPTETQGGRRPSPLSSFIHREVQTVSQQLDTVSAFLDDLWLVLIGKAAAPPLVYDALKAIASRRMPQLCIQDAASSHRDLSGWIRSLRQRLTALQSGDVDDLHVFDMSVFGRPEGFLDAAIRHLARQQFKSLHSVQLCIDVRSPTLCC